MSTLVGIQTLRGVSGLEESTKVVQAAVEKYNAGQPKDQQHVVEVFAALPPNTKGMQIRLSALAVQARQCGCTLIRLGVHNGNVAVCGLPEDVVRVAEQATLLYNVVSTKASQVYKPAEHGARMGFFNSFACGAIAGQDSSPAEIAYGVGTLFFFPVPGNAAAYELGYAFGQGESAPAQVPAKSTRTRKSA